MISWSLAAWSAWATSADGEHQLADASDDQVVVVGVQHGVGADQVCDGRLDSVARRQLVVASARKSEGKLPPATICPVVVKAARADKNVDADADPPKFSPQAVPSSEGRQPKVPSPPHPWLQRGKQQKGSHHYTCVAPAH